MKKFTVSEVRELAKHMESVGWQPDSKGDPECYDEGAARSAEILFAFADLLEAREKAVPVRQFRVVPKGSTWTDVNDDEIWAVVTAHPESYETRVLYAHSAQAQPPAARVTDTLAVFEVVSGVEGPCLTISRKADGKPRHEYRLAGPKPWGGGTTTHSFKVHTRELREQIDAIEAALAAQENPNG